MLSLQSHHITDLYVAVDDHIPVKSKPAGGRPSTLRDSEVVTILIWNCLCKVRQKTLKDIYDWVELEHAHDFPKRPSYQAFVDHCHRLIPTIVEFLSSLLVTNAPVRFIDSTMLQVCKLIRADRHKVAKGVAQMGKNWQGWHLGFKLHAAIDPDKRLAAFVFTPANMHDAQMLPYLVNKHTKVATGDGTYGASVMRKKIWETTGALIVAPPHYKQDKQLMADWQWLLLRARPKVECTFDYLKEHMHLVSSFPRSVNGYLLHYVRILLGYQIWRGVS
jgi:hypothetical protein